MKLDKLEPQSEEEFNFLKEQLIQYYPVLIDLRWEPGNVLNQITQLTAVNEKAFTKRITKISKKEVMKQHKFFLKIGRAHV